MRALDMNQIKSALKAPVMIDRRNIYPEEMRKRGLTYVSVGRA